MTNDVKPQGLSVTLADGEHTVSVDTLGLIEIEDKFEGFMELLRQFATKPVKTIVAVLEECEIDGDIWSREQIAKAIQKVPKVELASDLQIYLLDEMGYAEEKVDLKKAAQKLQEMGVDLSKVDPTKPETWVPDNLSALATEEKPTSKKTAKRSSKANGSTSTRS